MADVDVKSVANFAGSGIQLCLAQFRPARGFF